jgi:hypothetical protein
VLRREHLTAPPAVAGAFGVTATAAVHVIAALNTQIDELEMALADRFEKHPDADIYRSLSGTSVARLNLLYGCGAGLRLRSWSTRTGGNVGSSRQ